MGQTLSKSKKNESLKYSQWRTEFLLHHDSKEEEHAISKIISTARKASPFDTTNLASMAHGILVYPDLIEMLLNASSRLKEEKHATNMSISNQQQ